MSNLLQETVEEVLTLASFMTEPDPIDNSAKIMAAVASFGLACVMDSSISKECEEFLANYKEEE